MAVFRHASQGVTVRNFWLWTPRKLYPTFHESMWNPKHPALLATPRANHVPAMRQPCASTALTLNQGIIPCRMTLNPLINAKVVMFTFQGEMLFCNGIRLATYLSWVTKKKKKEIYCQNDSNRKAHREYWKGQPFKDMKTTRKARGEGKVNYLFLKPSIRRKEL